jgi:hypothetical protein
MKRYDIINALIETFSLRSFLEIGTFQGECFRNVRCAVKESVDPKYPATYEMTSNDFFAGPGFHNHYDLVYVDGLHTADQAFKDITDAFIYSHARFVVVHDCNPKTEWHARPPEQYKQGEEWNGDVYRGFIKFKSIAKALNTRHSCFVVDTDYGCGVITGDALLPNKSTPYRDDWEYFDQHREELLQLISVDSFKKLLE